MSDSQVPQQDAAMQVFEAANAAWERADFASFRDHCSRVLVAADSPVACRSYAHLRMAQSYIWPRGTRRRPETIMLSLHGHEMPICAPSPPYVVSLPAHAGIPQSFERRTHSVRQSSRELPPPLE